MPFCGWCRCRKNRPKRGSTATTPSAPVSSSLSGKASAFARQPANPPKDYAPDVDAAVAGDDDAVVFVDSAAQLARTAEFNANAGDETSNAQTATTTAAAAAGAPELQSTPVRTTASSQNSRNEDAGNPRNKCALQPGHSLMDWIRLGNSGADLAGNRGIPRPIALAELAQHNRADDAWMAVHGKCYNVTRYLNFHPGGCEELMRGVGKDATRLFDEVHAWVNYEQMLAKCYLGPLRVPGNFAGGSSGSGRVSAAGGEFKLPLQTLAPASTHTSPTRSSLTVAADAARRSASIDKSASLPASPTTTDADPSGGGSRADGDYEADVSAALRSVSGAPDDGPEIVPRFDWMQKSGELVLVFYTRALCNPGWSVRRHDDQDGGDDGDGDGGPRTWTAKRITVRVFAQRSVHVFAFAFLHAVRWPCTSRMSFDTGKFELIFRKRDAQLWTSFGILDRRKCCDPAEIAEPVEYDVAARVRITPDSFALLLRPSSAGVLQYVPVGFHVRIAAPAEVVGAPERPYTPVPMAFVPAELKEKQRTGASDEHNDEDATATVALLVKRYSEGGAGISGYLTRGGEPVADASLAVGLRVSQPRGGFSLYKTRLHTRVAMLAAGSGLTPMLSVLEYMLERTSNKMDSITLLYFNKTEADIWCRQHLDQLAEKDNRLRVVHYLSAVPQPDRWPAAQTGRIRAPIVAQLADKTSPLHSTYCFVCGPAAFNDECKRLLADCAGLDAGKVHVFH